MIVVPLPKNQAFDDALDSYLISHREKVMRSLKIKTTPILPGYQIYHNFIRENQGIANLTPAEKCGIRIEGENKWMTLIQNTM
ncbi:MAG: hypothetical protein ACRD47_00635 [Nitrososphaeraceae archaeon]|jgi:putative transposase